MAKRELDVANATNSSKERKSNIDINLEEDVLKYNVMPSLQHISLSSIIVTLWNQADIRYEIVKLFTEHEIDFCQVTDIYKLFLKIEDKVLDMVLQLPVPDCMRKMLSNIIHPIGKEIFDWIVCQDEYIFNTGSYEQHHYQKSMAINYIDDIVWTHRGIVDYKETAKVLLAKEEGLSDKYRYYIACDYCVEDYIAIIAPKVIGYTLNLQCIKKQIMAYYWTAHIMGDFTELDKAVDSFNSIQSTHYSTNEYIFKVLIYKSVNQVAIKYIWNKLSNEEKSRLIIPAINNTSNMDIRCFLLSQMNKEQERELFTGDSCQGILLSFLDDWLWGQFFLLTVHHIVDVMSGYDFLCLSKCILYKIDTNGDNTEKCTRYRAIFDELWQWAPQSVKRYVYDR